MRRLLRRLVHPVPVAIFFAGAGTSHLVRPEPWMTAVPDYLPEPRALVLLSGVAEIVGGLLIAHPRTRPVAGLYLVALLAAVFPANVHMAMNPERFTRGIPGGEVALWARLPLQLVLMAWVLRAARRGGAPDVPATPSVPTA